MSNEKRPYRMRKRAEAEEKTRLRITESTVALHEELGPSRTSVSAIAEHAGVRRSTVYRHFPDDAALFTACTAHWMAANPPPDLAAWSAISDPDERLAVGLGELYAYYRRTRQMMANIHRDEEIMPLVKEMMGGFRGYLAGARATLAEGREKGPWHPTVEAVLGHVLSFYVWRSLAIEQGLSDEACADLMSGLVRASARPVE